MQQHDSDSLPLVQPMRQGVIYFIQATELGYIKIGFTDSDDATTRLATLQTGSPVGLRIIGSVPGSQEDEKNFHRRFAAFRVHGEWFKPVPELMTIIQPADVISCDGVEIEEQTVSVRVLTVGRKQFTRSFLDQLPIVECLEWWPVEVEHDEEDGPTGTGSQVWGWVTGGRDKGRSYRWIIHKCKGQLCKCHDYDDEKFCGYADHIKDLYKERHRVHGYRPEDQLFIGV